MERVVDPDGGGGDGAGGLRSCGAISRERWPVAEFGRRFWHGGYEADGGGDSLDHLEVRLRGRARMRLYFCEGERLARFFLARARGEDQSARRLERPRSDVSKLDVAVGMPGCFCLRGRFFRGDSKLCDDVRDGMRPARMAVFGELEDGGFGVVEDGVGAVFALE